MSVSRLVRQTVVPTGLEETFAFFADAHNLESLTPPWVGFRILTPAPIAMRVGTLIDYRVRVHGVPLKWRTQIAEWDPPHQFVDVQLSGPYMRWHHTHTFAAFSGGTRVVDEVEYRAPFAWLTHPLLVSRDVARIFDYREDALQAALGRAAVR